MVATQMVTSVEPCRTPRPKYAALATRPVPNAIKNSNGAKPSRLNNLAPEVCEENKSAPSCLCEH
jgi:hypothetical protein